MGIHRRRVIEDMEVSAENRKMVSEETLNLVTKKNGKIRKYLAYALIIFTIHSTFAFMCFIVEEGMQTAMFGAFAYQNAKDWEGLYWHIENVMKPAHTSGEFLIRNFGWLAPVTYPAYLQYARINKAYILSVERRVRRELDSS